MKDPTAPKTVSCTRRLQFCAGHRVFQHESKCAHIHGHNYVALITCEAPELDPQGRVIDFSVVKKLVGSWIEEYWDHKMILCADDDEMITALQNITPLYVLWNNPTAENMAKHLMDIGNSLLPEPLVCTRVELWETENCRAEVAL